MQEKEFRMATIQCKKCGRRIMAKEKVCPHCGEPVPHDMFDISIPKFMKKDESKKKKISHFSVDDSNDQEAEHEKESPKTNENLITCKACGKQISKNVSSCPHCGEPVPKVKPPSKWKGILYVVAIFYGITFILWITKSGYYSHENSIKRQQDYAANKIDKPKTELRKTLKGGYAACTSKNLFNEISMASANKDTLQIGHLLSSGNCVLTKAGVRFSYIEGAGLGVAKIRVYDGADSIILYTNHENIWY